MPGAFSIQTTQFVSDWRPRYGSIDRRLQKATVEWQADDADALVPELTSITPIHGMLHQASVVSGTPAPSNNYSIKVVDSDGVDFLLDACKNCGMNDTEMFGIQFAEGDHPICLDILTFILTGNNVNGARGKFTLYFTAP